MKVDIEMYKLTQKSTTTKENDFKLNISAVGFEYEINKFYKYICDYQKPKQKDVIKK